jgi:hypothetical protein
MCGTKIKMRTETLPIYFPELEPKVHQKVKRKYPTTLANNSIVGRLFKKKHWIITFFIPY